jgi:hypothetical protein
MSSYAAERFFRDVLNYITLLIDKFYGLKNIYSFIFYYINLWFQKYVFFYILLYYVYFYILTRNPPVVWTLLILEVFISITTFIIKKLYILLKYNLYLNQL